MTLVVLAAGMGSRFGGLKQIEPVGPNEEFIIDYSIYDANRVGFDKVIFVIKEENYDIFKNTIGKRISNYMDVEYVFQNNDNLNFSIPNDRIKPLGTAHAILCCKDKVKENFAIINADDFYGYDAYKILGDYLKNNNNLDEYLLVGYKVTNTLTENGSVKRGICKVNNGYLSKINESVISCNNNVLEAYDILTNDKVDVNEDSIVSMNMFGFTPKIFEYLENDIELFFRNNDITSCEYLIPSEVSRYIEEGKVKVKVINTNSNWYGITYREDLNNLKINVKKLIDKGVYPHKLWK